MSDARALLARHKMLRDAYRGDEVRILPDGTRAIDVICQLYDALEAEVNAPNAYRAGIEAAKVRIEARRQRILATPGDPSWTEHFTDLEKELDCLPDLVETGANG